MRIIGVLTSGGDAPGMNACIRAVVRTALYFGMKVYGISRGYYGLVNDDVIEMHLDLSDIIRRGGTILTPRGATSSRPKRVWKSRFLQ